MHVHAACVCLTPLHTHYGLARMLMSWLPHLCRHDRLIHIEGLLWRWLAALLAALAARHRTLLAAARALGLAGAPTSLATAWTSMALVTGGLAACLMMACGGRTTGAAARASLQANKTELWQVGPGCAHMSGRNLRCTAAWHVNAHVIVVLLVERAN